MSEGREEKQRIDSREPWSEKDSAIYMANKALDTQFADPDSDLCTISRQFLRAVEQLAKAKEDFDKLHTASNLTLNELAKERQLRKELAEALNFIEPRYSYFNKRVSDEAISKLMKALSNNKGT